MEKWNRLRNYTPPSEYDQFEDSLEDPDSTLYDNLDDDDISINEIIESSSSQSLNGPKNDTLQPEKINISLPSKWNLDDHPYYQIELKLRIKQAAASLSSLRDLIADKSFQYSHIIRVAPRKGVRTRARSTIAQLNTRIGFHCRVYNRCRAAMEKLNADFDILSKYQILSRQDIKSSSALLNPNEPGSTTHRLSWIWQSGSLNTASSDGLRECKAILFLFLFFPISLFSQSSSLATCTCSNATLERRTYPCWL